MGRCQLVDGANTYEGLESIGTQSIGTGAWGMTGSFLALLGLTQRLKGLPNSNLRPDDEKLGVTDKNASVIWLFSQHGLCLGLTPRFATNKL